MTMKHLNTNEESMRGLFFIIKGQYKPDKRGDNTRGYDPFNTETPEWYMLLDNRTFTCVSCGGDLNTVLKGVYKTIKRHKGVAERYFNQVSMSCSKSSPSTKDIYKEVFEEFGDFYEVEVKEMEDLAFEELKQDKPIFKSRKLVGKHKEHLGEIETTPAKEEKVLVINTIPLVKHKKVMGIKKLVMTEI